MFTNGILEEVYNPEYGTCGGDPSVFEFESYFVYFTTTCDSFVLTGNNLETLAKVPASNYDDGEIYFNFDTKDYSSDVVFLRKPSTQESKFSLKESIQE